MAMSRRSFQPNWPRPLPSVFKMSSKLNTHPSHSHLFRSSIVYHHCVQIVTKILKVREHFLRPFPHDEPDGQCDGDKEQTLIAAAQTIMTSCGSETFTVSFVQDAGFALPEGRSRLYLKDASAAEAQSLALQSGLVEPATQLVFLTEIHDTRFDAYCVLRPLDAAH